MWVLLLRLLAIFSPLSGFAQICFIHVPKTAGTTINTVLREHFDESCIYPYGKMESLFPYKDVREGKRVLRAISPLKEQPLVPYSIVAGHFPPWWLEKKGLDPNPFYFTVLRDPVERVLSQYFFTAKTISEKGKEQIPDFSPLDVFPNHMCHMFSSDPNLTDRKLLESAIQNLEKMDFIVFMDDFEGGVRRLFEKMGFAHEGEIPILNATERSEIFDEEMIEKIRRRNIWDQRLYEYAITHFREKSL